MKPCFHSLGAWARSGWSRGEVGDSVGEAREGTGDRRRQGHALRARTPAPVPGSSGLRSRVPPRLPWREKEETLLTAFLSLSMCLPGHRPRAARVEGPLRPPSPLLRSLPRPGTRTPFFLSSTRCSKLVEGPSLPQSFLLNSPGRAARHPPPRSTCCRPGGLGPSLALLLAHTRSDTGPTSAPRRGRPPSGCPHSAPSWALPRNYSSLAVVPRDGSLRQGPERPKDVTCLRVTRSERDGKRASGSGPQAPGSSCPSTEAHVTLAVGLPSEPPAGARPGLFGGRLEPLCSGVSRAARARSCQGLAQARGTCNAGSGRLWSHGDSTGPSPGVEVPWDVHDQRPRARTRK